MVTAAKDPNLSEQKIEIVHNIQAWFTAETTHQRAAGFKSGNGTPAQTRDDMLARQIRNEWNHFRRLRTGGETKIDEQTRKLQVGQGVLKACVAAQAAYAWHEVERGRAYDEALYGTLGLIDGYVTQIETGKELPSYHLLDKPIHEAVNEYAAIPNAYYRPVSTFNNLAYLATSAIIEQYDGDKDFALPQPAVVDGDVLIPWRHF
jgi:hypothetical protein